MAAPTATGIIYKVTNIINGKVYIGQTIKPLYIRKNCHMQYSKREGCFYFHNALKKYGIENFSWEIIFKTENKFELNGKEKYYIKLYKSNNKNFGYNQTSGGSNMTNQSIETIEKRRMKLIGKKRTEEQRKNLSDWQKGKSFEDKYGKEKSIEMKKKISEFMKLRSVSEETRKKRSISCINSGCGKWMLGKKHSEETKNKLKGRIAVNRKQIFCVETGEKFESVSKCSIEMNIDKSCIFQVLKERKKSTSGYSFKYLEVAV